MSRFILPVTKVVMMACVCVMLQGCSVAFRIFLVNKTSEPVPVTVTFRDPDRVFFPNNNEYVKYTKGTPKIKHSLEKRLNDSIPVTFINDTTAQVMLPAASTTLIQKYLNGSPVGTVTIGAGAGAKRYTFSEFYSECRRSGFFTMPVNLRYEIREGAMK